MAMMLDAPLVDNCQRCGADLAPGCIVSKFNLDWLCMDCKDDEEMAPGYAAADAAEIAQVRAGNRNYPGVGLSMADREFLAAARAARSKEMR